MVDTDSLKVHVDTMTMSNQTYYNMCDYYDRKTEAEGPMVMHYQDCAAADDLSED